MYKFQKLYKTIFICKYIKSLFRYRIKECCLLNIKEIAQYAGVSSATVSLVLNHKKGVSDEVRKQISKLLIENGYVLNRNESTQKFKKSIRFLKYKKHSLLVDGNAGFINSIIDALEKECRLLGFNMVINVFDDSNMKEIFDMVVSNPLDGVILLATEFEKQDLHYIKNLTVPTVIVDSYFDYESVNCVNMNNKDMVYLAIEHFAKLGHSRIGYVHSSIDTNNFTERYYSYIDALKELNLAPYDTNLVFRAMPTLNGAYKSISTLIANGVQFPSALFCDNDTIALGAIKAFKEGGYHIPEDISIIGFDNIDFGSISDPPLTTLAVSCKDMGIWTVRMLCDRINYKNSPIFKTQIGGHLIERKSTCAYLKK